MYSCCIEARENVGHTKLSSRSRQERGDAGAVTTDALKPSVHSPWINGSVERVNRDILQVVRVLNLEYKIHHRDWVYLVSMVQSSINHTPLPSLGNCVPVELFTGLSCPTPLREFYCPATVNSSKFRPILT